MKGGIIVVESSPEKPGVVSLQVKVCAVTMAARVLVNPIVASPEQPAKLVPLECEVWLIGERLGW